MTSYYDPTMSIAKNAISCPRCKAPRKHPCRTRNGKKLPNGHMARLYVWIRTTEPDRT